MEHREGYYDPTPFKDSLTPVFESSSERIRELKNNPDKLVRTFPFKTQELEKSIENLKRGVGVFNKLEQRYNIAVPHVDLVIGKKGTVGEDATVFTITDRIIGENLGDIKQLPESSKDMLENFIISMSQYFMDAQKENGDYWEDFFEDQIVYGHKKLENENRFYIVDLDPRYQTYKKDDPQRGSKLFDCFNRVFSFIKYLEYKVSAQPVKLTKAREALSKILSEIPQSVPDYHVIEQLKNSINVSE